MAVTVRQLLEKKARIASEMRQIVDGGDDSGGLTEEQQAAFDKLKAALQELEQAIANRSLIEDIERRMAGAPMGSTGDRHLDQELRSFSLVRAIASAAGLNVDAGRERELSAEVARRSGRTFQGIAVPLSIFRKPVERRVITSTGTPATPGYGGSLIQTTVDGTQYIQPLYAALVIRKLGARVLENLVGNLTLPRMADSTQAGWVAENTALPENDQGFDGVTLTPKNAGAYTELSRNVLIQSTPDVEELVRADFAQVLARALDLAAIAGTGPTNNQPTGILATSGIGSVAIGDNGGPITWPSVLQLIETLENANVGDDARAFLGNPKVKAQAMQTPKVAGVALGFVQDDPEEMAGYRFASTTQVPSNGAKGSGTGLSTLIYGNWSDLVMGIWSELDVLVNPYAETAYQKGNVQVRAMLTCDIALRHPQSFAAITDIAAP